MAKQQSKFEELLDEGLENARKDRKKAEEAYSRVEEVLSVETEEHIQKLMLVGGTAVKILEQLSRANEQIVKLAQIKERQDGKKSEERHKFDIQSMREEMGELELEEVKVRVDVKKDGR